MNEHTRIRQNLSLYLDGAVTEAERKEIDEHLAQCPRCCEALVELGITVAHLREQPGVEPPPWLTAKIMARVREEAENKRTFWQRLFFPLYIKIPLEAMAVLFLCVTGYYMAQNMAPELHISAPSAVTKKGASPQQLPQPLETITQKRDKGQAAPPTRPTAPAKDGEMKIPDLPPATSVPALPPQSFAPPPPPIKARAPLQVPQSGAERLSPPEARPEPGVKLLETIRPNTEMRAAEEPTLETNGFAEHRTKKAKKSATSRGLMYGTPAPAPAPWQQLTLRVADFPSAEASIEEVVNKAAGTIILRESTATGNRITLRIPVTQFNEFFSRLEKIGSIAPKPTVPEGRTGYVELVLLLESAK